jgi:hypothetical protein
MQRLQGSLEVLTGHGPRFGPRLRRDQLLKVVRIIDLLQPCRRSTSLGSKQEVGLSNGEPRQP